MLTAALNWIRRGLALVILVGLCLPLVTVHGCKGEPDITYSGWEAVIGSPYLALVSMPLFAVGVVVLTLLSRRPATAVGRLILALMRLVGSGAAAVWSAFFILTLPPNISRDAEPGSWVLCGAWLALVLADAVDLVRHWRAWNHWRRGREFTPLDDDTVRMVGWGSYISGGCVVLTVAASYAAGEVKGLSDLDFQMLLHGALVLLLAWWGLACLGGWGLLRGLRWAFVLQCVGGAGVILLAGPAIALAVYDMSNRPGPATVPTEQGEILALGLLLLAVLWLGWAVWSLAAIFPRRRLFVRPPADEEPFPLAMRG